MTLHRGNAMKSLPIKSTMAYLNNVTVVVSEGVDIPEDLPAMLKERGFIQMDLVILDVKRYLESGNRGDILWIGDDITDNWEIILDRSLRKHGVYRLQPSRPFNMATLLT